MSSKEKAAREAEELLDEDRQEAEGYPDDAEMARKAARLMPREPRIEARVLVYAGGLLRWEWTGMFGEEDFAVKARENAARAQAEFPGDRIVQVLAGSQRLRIGNGTGRIELQDPGTDRLAGKEG